MSIDKLIAKSGIRARLNAAANGLYTLKTERGDYGLLEDALDEINRLRDALNLAIGLGQELGLTEMEVDAIMQKSKP